MERRTSQRVLLDRACTIHRDWPVPASWTGVTLNMSRDGALIDMQVDDGGHSITTGDNVSVDLLLEESQRFEQRCMHCHGVIVRVDPHLESTRVSVQFVATAIRPVAESWRWTPCELVN